MSHCPYSSVVRNIMYAIVCTRLDISQVVSVINFYMANLGKAHWEAMKWILQCLQDTRDVSLVYDGNRDLSSTVIEYVNSDFVGDLNKRSFLTSYFCTFSRHGINWKETLQSMVTFSTT